MQQKSSWRPGSVWIFSREVRQRLTGEPVNCDLVLRVELRRRDSGKERAASCARYAGRMQMVFQGNGLRCWVFRLEPIWGGLFDVESGSRQARLSAIARHSMKGHGRPCSIKPQQTSSRNVLQRPVEPDQDVPRSFGNRSKREIWERSSHCASPTSQSGGNRRVLLDELALFQFRPELRRDLD
jgi:hypothetical protein